MKLYVVTLADLSAGDQLAQTLHAGLEYALNQRDRALLWWKNSNTVVCLVAPNVAYLEMLADKLFIKQISYELFREPDLNNQITALAFIADKNPCGNLPLAMKS